MCLPLLTIWWNRSSNCWDIQCDMLTFAISFKNVHLLLLLGLLDWSSSKFFLIRMAILQSILVCHCARWTYVPKFWLKLVVILAASFEESKKEVPWSSSNIYLSCGEKIVKIGPVDPEIIWLQLKKLTQTKHIAFLKSSSSGLKYTLEIAWDCLGQAGLCQGWYGTQRLVKLWYSMYIAGHRQPLPVILTNHSHVLEIPY